MKETLHIYTRVSTGKQVEEGYSLKSQRDLGIKKSKELGFKYKLYEEEGKSGSHDNFDNRPQITKLLDLCDEGKIKHVFVTEWDRLTRSDITQIYIKKIFKDNNVILHTISQRFDLTDEEQEFISDLTTLLSKRENKKRVRLSKRGIYESVKQGKHHGGITPYGFKTDNEKKLVIDDEEKEGYLKIVELSLKGVGVNTISRTLNDLNIPTKGQKLYKKGIHIRDKRTGKLSFKKKEDLIWKGGTVLGILKNPIYKGEMKFKDLTVKISPLISSEDWDRIQENLIKNKNNSSRNNTKHFYILKGLLTCNRCGGRLYGLIKPNRRMRSYSCISKRPDPHPRFCGMKNINLDKINNLVWNILMNILGNSNVSRREFKKLYKEQGIDEKKVKRELEKLKRELKDIDEEKSRIITLYGRKGISDEDLDNHLLKVQENIKTIKERDKKLNNQLELVKKGDGTYSWILKFSDKMDFISKNSSDEEKRRIIRLFVDKILVDYLDKEKEHVIEIELKFPLFEQKETKEQYLLKGMKIPKKNQEKDPPIVIESEILDYYNRWYSLFKIPNSLFIHLIVKSTTVSELYLVDNRILSVSESG